MLMKSYVHRSLQISYDYLISIFVSFYYFSTLLYLYALLQTTSYLDASEQEGTTGSLILRITFFQPLRLTVGLQEGVGI
jgi:hypothetical protein